MDRLLLSLCGSWYEFYGEINRPDNPLGAVCWSVYIKNAQIENIGSLDGNGAIYWIDADKESKLLVEDCSFANCKASYGLAIHKESEGQCVINRVCGMSCNANAVYAGQNYGIFHRILSSQSVDAKNMILESSVSKITGLTAGYVCFHYYGACITKSLNTSHNNVKVCSGLFLWYSANQAKASFSSFMNGVASEREAVTFGSDEFELTTSNIIDNEQNSTGSGITS